eukprot:7313378-Prymnesium_polylepis.2
MVPEPAARAQQTPKSWRVVDTDISLMSRRHVPHAVRCCGAGVAASGGATRPAVRRSAVRRGAAKSHMSPGTGSGSCKRGAAHTTPFILTPQITAVYRRKTRVPSVTSALGTIIRGFSPRRRTLIGDSYNTACTMPAPSDRISQHGAMRK